MESEPDSVYFSVTSYDDDIAAEQKTEKEQFSNPLPLEDLLLQRRSRRAVYTQPLALLPLLVAANMVASLPIALADPLVKPSGKMMMHPSQYM